MNRSRPIRVTRNAGLGRADLRALGTSVCVLTADSTMVAAAGLEVQNELAGIDAACNTARNDSELQVANRAGGHQVAVGPLLADAVDAALRAARQTGGALDSSAGSGPDGPGWDSIRFNRQWGTLQMPAGVQLDLAEILPALAADRAAARAAAATGQGVLVGVGRCVAVVGTPPPGAWNISVADRTGRPGPAVRLLSGGLATAEGRPGTSGWRSATVTAPTCLDARSAAATAILFEEQATAWLTSKGLAARLVGPDGSEALVGDWPDGVRAA